MSKDLAKVTVISKTGVTTVYENVGSISTEDGMFEIEQEGKTSYWPFESVEHVSVEG
jgi:hypothetical protein